MAKEFVKYEVQVTDWYNEPVPFEHYGDDINTAAEAFVSENDDGDDYNSLSTKGVEVLIRKVGDDTFTKLRVKAEAVIEYTATDA